MKIPQPFTIYLALFILTVPVSESESFLKSKSRVQGQRYPNVVVMVADDLGIGDIGCYGNNSINTPNIDRLASEGVKLTHHLASASMCTPSRAGLLTARYAARYGLAGDVGTPTVIVHVASRVGLPESEITLGRALSSVNYTTAAVGKWHLGSNCKFLGIGCNGPQQHGFQHFYGLPFTLTEAFRGDHAFWIFPLEDPFYQGLIVSWLLTIAMFLTAKQKLQWKAIPVLLYGILFIIFLGIWFLHTHYRFHTARWWQVSPWMDQRLNGILMHNDKVIEQPLTLDGLMQNLVNFSTKFIQDHANDEQPFFLYHSFAHVHPPMFTAPVMKGRSKFGRYGDNVEEMDVGVGIIMETIRKLGLDENTIIYFVSDHGGALEYVDEDGQRIGGYNGLFKGGKGQGASEGGIRVPGIYRWKGRLPSAVTVDAPTSLMDLMPTSLELAGIPPLYDLMPQMVHKELDGNSIVDLLLQKGKPDPRIFIHHCRRAIHGLRWAQEHHIYKMFLVRHKFPWGSAQCGWGITQCNCFGDDVVDISHEPMLFDLKQDPYEDHPIPSNTSEYQKVVGYLKQYLNDWKHRVPYPPSQFSNKLNTVLTPWLQPFCVYC